MKRFTIFAGLVALMLYSISSCGEKDLLTDEEHNPDTRNVEVWIYSYWGPDVFSFDSVYQVNGARIVITDVKLLFSDYEFAILEDTVDEEQSYAVASIRNLKHKVGYLPPGTYTGEHQLYAGFDSAVYFSPAIIGSVTNDADMKRSTFGYNHLVVKGKFISDDDTINVGPVAPFTYRLAGPEFSRLNEVSMSFSVSHNSKVPILINFDIAQLFAGLSPSEISNIKCDPMNIDDYAAAEILSSNFGQALVFEQ